MPYLYVLGAATRRGPAVGSTHARPVPCVVGDARPYTALAYPSQRGGGAGGPPRHYEETKKLACILHFLTSFVSAPVALRFIHSWRTYTYWALPHVAAPARVRPQADAACGSAPHEAPRSGRDPPWLVFTPSPEGVTEPPALRANTLCTCLFHVSRHFHVSYIPGSAAHLGSRTSWALRIRVPASCRVL